MEELIQAVKAQVQQQRTQQCLQKELEILKTNKGISNFLRKKELQIQFLSSSIAQKKE